MEKEYDLNHYRYNVMRKLYKLIGAKTACFGGAEHLAEQCVNDPGGMSDVRYKHEWDRYIIATNWLIDNGMIILGVRFRKPCQATEKGYEYYLKYHNVSYSL